ncbi:MAG: sodium/proton-translocating pyrophosphatase, partial [Candidatus Aenigmarchaeota archaeon]|nr:sodium/proton-translocating pyrophosphatase [Candidatus Aenigmarchaeota archaeon]
MESLILLSIIAGMFSIAFAGVLALSVLRHPRGNEKMRSIADAIHEGAMAYLNRQSKTVAVFVALIAAILYYAIGSPTAIGFVVGAIFSAVAGYIGMNISVRANVRTAEAARTGVNDALNVAFRGGAVSGLSV